MKHRLIKKESAQDGVMNQILRFSLPYMLSYFLQTLYGMADLYIIGRFNGTASITAVSIGSQVMHMLTVMIVGLAMGVTVSVGRSVGENRPDKIGDAIGNTATVFAVGSVAVTALLLVLIKPIVSLIATPAEAVSGTVAYLTVCFIGIPFITAYNGISSVFRGLGDSKSPLYFVAVACGANVALDFLFIGGLRLGPTGAALGTVLSQTASVIVSLFFMRKKKRCWRLSRVGFRPRRSVAAPIFRVGIPISLQDGLIQVAFMLITVIANQRGLNDAAAVGIVEKFIGAVFIIPSSMLSTVSALASQYFGAGQPGRARKTMRIAILLSVGFGMAVTALSIAFAPIILGAFERNVGVIRLGSQYLRGYVADCIFAGVHFCFSGYFCACEHSGISFLHNIASVVLIRVPVAYLASKSFADTLFPMGTAAPLGSALSVAICMIAYAVLLRRERRGVQNL